MALGLMETEEIVKSGADGLGNPVLYVGSTTGEMGWAALVLPVRNWRRVGGRPSSGRSLLEKSLIEACLEAFKTGAVVAAQDRGSWNYLPTSEMAAKAVSGLN